VASVNSNNRTTVGAGGDVVLVDYRLGLAALREPRAGLVARARGAAIAPQVLGDVRAVAGGDYFRTACDAANAKRGCELRNCCVVVNARV